MESPPADSRLRCEVTPDGITVRSVPPPPATAAVLCTLILFTPSALWVSAYTFRTKTPFPIFFGLVILALVLTLLAAACLTAFLGRLAGPPTWHVTTHELSARRLGALLPRRFRFGRLEIVTVRSDGSSLQVVIQRAGQWRAESFPLLTTGGEWLAGIIATKLDLAPLPYRYVMVRTPGDGSPDEITYGFEDAGGRWQVATSGVRATSPEGDPPADAVIGIGRTGDSWSVARPRAGWFERIATWAVLGIVVLALFIWVVRSADGLGVALTLVIVWAFFGRAIRERVARACGPTVLTYADDALQLSRPIGWGTVRHTIPWWMIRSVSLRPTVRRGRARADLRVHTKTGGVVPLFTSLPERDARWVAALVGGTFGMEEAEATWGPWEERTIGPR